MGIRKGTFKALEKNPDSIETPNKEQWTKNESLSPPIDEENEDMKDNGKWG